VPNFHEGNVEFDQAGQPEAINIWSVNKTMTALEHKADKFKWDHEQELKKDGLDTYDKRFETRKKNISANVDNWMSSQFSSSAEGDQLVNVTSKGDRDVRFAPCNRFSAGLFVSKTSFKALFEEFPEKKLTYKLEKFPTNIVVIGLVNTDTELTDCEHFVSKAPILGHTEHSLGIDCTKGEINSRIGGKAETVQHEGSPADPTNTELVITFEIADSTATLSIVIDNAPSKTITISSFNPNTVFPAIEFRIPDDARDSLRTSACSVDDVKHLSSNFSLTDKMNKLPGVVDSEPKHENSVRSGESDPGKWGNRNFGKMIAVVTLPFNLLYNCHEIFLVCINSVVRQYRSMHDHGELGHEALGWLMEAAGEALDCVNGELSAMKVSDFVGLLDSGGTRLSFGEKLIGTIKGASHADKAEAVTSFEPIIVEYLWLVQQCQMPAWTDSYPASMPFATGIKQMGYTHSRTRVEALWAYVECHERVLHKLDAHILKRFPQLREVLFGIIQEVKERDLPFVRDMKPGHYLYSQHYLALRTVLSKRVDKLKSHSNEGWLSRKDVDPLLDDLSERLMKVESYFPKINLKAQNIDEDRSERTEFCAWDDETFA
jgi:hypothetical protein